MDPHDIIIGKEKPTVYLFCSFSSLNDWKNQYKIVTTDQIKLGPSLSQVSFFDISFSNFASNLFNSLKIAVDLALMTKPVTARLCCRGYYTILH